MNKSNQTEHTSPEITTSNPQSNRGHVPQLFPLGGVMIYHQVVQIIGHEGVASLLLRHATGDWGELCEHHQQLNHEAIKSGKRVVSVYKHASGTPICILTEGNRRSTLVFLEHQYPGPAAEDIR
jgi:hypothetical protein